MLDEPSPHPNWRIERQPTHFELEYRLREGAALWVITAIGGGCVLFFGFWTAVMLRSVMAAPASTPIAGYVFLLATLAGLGFGAYTVARLFASTHYRFHRELLEVEAKEPLKKTVTEIPRLLVTGLTRVYTPSKAVRGEDTFKLILHWETPESQSRWIAFEGTTKVEAEWLGSMLAEWSGKPVQEERSGS